MYLVIADIQILQLSLSFFFLILAKYLLIFYLKNIYIQVYRKEIDYKLSKPGGN